MIPNIKHLEICFVNTVIHKLLITIKTKTKMSIVKVIEVIATSNKSFDDATKNAVSEAAKTVKNIKSVYIENMKAKVENNKITSYAVNAKISFEIS